MARTHITAAGALLVLAACFGCSTQDNNAVAPAAGEVATSLQSRKPEVGVDPTNIDPADFVAEIDNPFFPLVPGARYLYRSETEDGTEEAEDVVTADTKVILGVTTRVVHNRVTLDGSLIEDTFDWYAQDVAGNVWYFGEDTKQYEGGQVIGTAGSWEAGVDGALPGIIMLAHPRRGVEYAQEFAPGVAEDRALVVALDRRVTGPLGRFDDCVKTKEWTPLEPGVFEFKLYAPGVGLVLVLNPATHEREELVSATGLPPDDGDGDDDHDGHGRHGDRGGRGGRGGR